MSQQLSYLLLSLAHDYLVLMSISRVVGQQLPYLVVVSSPRVAGQQLSYLVMVSSP